jgi:hypothetical protein
MNDQLMTDEQFAGLVTGAFTGFIVGLLLFVLIA